VELETYLLLDEGLSPQEKNAAMQVLQPEFLGECRAKGAESVTAWIPENVEEIFRKRLLQLGWTPDREGWHTWSRTTEEKND
jgi:hypothetical protein